MDRTTTISVDGMTCSSCVKHVSEALAELPGVLDVTVELRTGQSSPVTVVSNDPLDADAIRAAVDEAGYEVASID